MGLFKKMYEVQTYGNAVLCGGDNFAPPLVTSGRNFNSARVTVVEWGSDWGDGKYSYIKCCYGDQQYIIYGPKVKKVK